MIRRILGPQHVRLLEVVTDEAADRARKFGGVAKKGILSGGVIGATVASQLLEAGWKDYAGPALAIDGWVTDASSDPNVKPRPLDWKGPRA